MRLSSFEGYEVEQKSEDIRKRLKAKSNTEHKYRWKFLPRRLHQWHTDRGVDVTAICVKCQRVNKRTFVSMRRPHRRSDRFSGGGIATKRLSSPRELGRLPGSRVGCKF